jgi:ubiquitin-protein ligase
MANNSVIKKDTIHRLIGDIKKIKKSPLHTEGIFYEHDDENLLKGYAMIIGPKDTPYENGLYFFNLAFPCDYPYSPPTLTYMTNDGETRFNPNLYRGAGKVCLSILNTWRGEQWSSCQSITSILLTLVTIFNENPLLNEPGIVSTCSDIPIYNRILQYKNYEVSICNLVTRMNSKKINKCEICFKEEITQHINNNHKHMLDNVKKMMGDYDSGILSTSLYNMNIKVDYKNLYTKIKNINIKKLK